MGVVRLQGLFVVATIFGACKSELNDGDAGPDAADASAECDPVRCSLDCELARDENGCKVCACRVFDKSCSMDSDCVLASDFLRCCACPWTMALSKSTVEADGCLWTPGEPAVDTADACANECTEKACPNACGEEVRRAVCTDGMCVGDTECAAGDVFDALRECVPACANHADCTMALNFAACCGGCQAHHVSLLATYECLAADRADVPTNCFQACRGVRCAVFDSCTGEPAAVCLSTGECAPGPCPSGTEDRDGKCQS